MPYFQVTPLNRVERCADRLAYPVMQFLAGPGDSPQLTHFWNNTRVKRAAVDHLDPDMMASFRGDASAPVRTWRLDVRFHLGAWKNYVVLQPKSYRGKWYVGWRTANGAGFSRIPVTNCVRGLIGPDDVEFFGVRHGIWEQIPVQIVATGELGDGCFTGVPLY